MLATQAAARPLVVEPADPLRQQSDADLYAALDRCLYRIEELLIEAARIYTVLRDRGADLTRYSRTLAAYLPRIAAGTVTPEAVKTFGGDRRLLRLVAQFPPAQQVAFASGEPVPVAVYDPRTNEATEVRRPLVLLAKDEIPRVFDTEECRVRSVEEQQVMLARDSEHRAGAGPIRLRLTRTERIKLEAAAKRRGKSPEEFALDALRNAGVF